MSIRREGWLLMGWAHLHPVGGWRGPYPLKLHIKIWVSSVHPIRIRANILRFPSISKEVLVTGQCWHLERLWFVIHVVEKIVLKVVAVTFRWLSLTIIVERSNVKIPLALALATSNHPKCQPRWKIWHLSKVITDIAIVMTSMELWRYQTTTNWAQMVPVFLQVLFSTF